MLATKILLSRQKKPVRFFPKTIWQHCGEHHSFSNSWYERTRGGGNFRRWREEIAKTSFMGILHPSSFSSKNIRKKLLAILFSGREGGKSDGRMTGKKGGWNLLHILQ